MVWGDSQGRSFQDLSYYLVITIIIIPPRITPYEEVSYNTVQPKQMIKLKSLTIAYLIYEYMAAAGKSPESYPKAMAPS